MAVARRTRNKTLRPGNLYLAKMNPEREEVNKILKAEIVETKRVFRKYLPKGASRRTVR